MKTTISKNHRRTRVRTFRKNLSQYAAAAVATSAVSAQAQSLFTTPYAVPASNYVGSAAISGPIGDWLGAISGGTFDTFIQQPSVNATNSPNSILFSFRAATAGGTPTYDFTANAQAAGNVSFNLSGLSTLGTASAVFTKNGASQGSILANNSYSFAVNSGDVFGFRFAVSYTSINGTLQAQISNFDGPVAVPEPSTYALWMSAGAVGLLAMRQSRQRKTSSSR
jgi:hypothetical protein